MYTAGWDLGYNTCGNCNALTCLIAKLLSEFQNLSPTPILGKFFFANKISNVICHNLVSNLSLHSLGYLKFWVIFKKPFLAPTGALYVLMRYYRSAERFWAFRLPFSHTIVGSLKQKRTSGPFRGSSGQNAFWETAENDQRPLGETALPGRLCMNLENWVKRPGGQIWSQLPQIGPPGLDSWSPHTLP